MTSNPYAQTDFGPDYFPEQRTSVMAILSLVFSLICCIPGTGVLGIVLGIASVVAIASAQGRLVGRGMAIAGIIIGVFTTVMWLAVGFGAISLVGGLNIYGEAIEDMQAGRPTDARVVLATPADAAVTDEQLVAFGERITNEWGAYAGMPGGLFDWFGAYAEIGQTIGSTQPAAQAVYGDELIPVPVRFDGGTTIVWVAIGQAPVTGRQMPAALNLGFVDQSGQIVWLIDPQQSGAGTVTPPAPPPPPATTPPTPAPVEEGEAETIPGAETTPGTEPTPEPEPTDEPETAPAGDEGG